MYKPRLVEFDAVLAVARLRSFKAAAAELEMSTTALSHAVAALEAQLGLRLLRPTIRSVAFTETGKKLFAEIAPSLSNIHAAMDDASSRQWTMTGTLRISAALGAARHVFQPILIEYLRRHSHMCIDLVT